MNRLLSLAEGSEFQLCYMFSPIEPQRPGVPDLERIRQDRNAVTAPHNAQDHHLTPHNVLHAQDQLTSRLTRSFTHHSPHVSQDPHAHRPPFLTPHNFLSCTASRLQLGTVMSLGVDTILAAGIMGLVTSINSLPLEKTIYQLTVERVKESPTHDSLKAPADTTHSRPPRSERVAHARLTQGPPRSKSVAHARFTQPPRNALTSRLSQHPSRTNQVVLVVLLIRTVLSGAVRAETHEIEAKVRPRLCLLHSLASSPDRPPLRRSSSKKRRRSRRYCDRMRTHPA